MANILTYYYFYFTCGNTHYVARNPQQSASEDVHSSFSREKKNPIVDRITRCFIYVLSISKTFKIQ